MAFAAVFGGLLYVIDLPLSFFSSNILPHRYGLSNQTITGWLSDQLKGLVVGLLIGGAMLEIFYAVLRVTPGTWWIWGRIVLGDTLLGDFSSEEIETIFAHELGHHVHKDIPTGILVESVLTFGGLFLASLGLKWGVEFFNFDSPADIAGFPLLLLILGAYGLISMPLSNAYSRWRERRADEYALHMTGNGEVYANALTRLANQNLAEVDPEPWVEMLLYSHPALGKRISRARNFNLSSKS